MLLKVDQYQLKSWALNVHDCNIHYLKTLREKCTDMFKRKQVLSSDFVTGLKHNGKHNIQHYKMERFIFLLWVCNATWILTKSPHYDRINL